MLIGLLKTMRPRQWVTKNGLVFTALFFDSKLNLAEIDSIIRTIVAFLLFCLISGAVYIMNDLIDIEGDRQHPRKRFRPLPSGQLSPRFAAGAAIFFFIFTISAAFILDAAWGTRLAWIILAYALLQVAYTMRLKHVVILDVSIVAAGFILRVAAGVVVIEVTRFSPWLYVCMGLLALFLVLGKRRHELTLLGESAGDHRAILKEYNLDLIDRLMGIVTTSAIVSYSQYTFLAEGLPENHLMMLTIPFVIYGIFRYLYLIHVRGEGGAPDEVALRDRPLQITVALFALTIFYVLYLSPSV